jgi:hypothetical protein
MTVARRWWRIGAHLVPRRRRRRLASSYSVAGSGSTARRPSTQEVRPGDSSAAAAEVVKGGMDGFQIPLPVSPFLPFQLSPTFRLPSFPLA